MNFTLASELAVIRTSKFYKLQGNFTNFGVYFVSSMLKRIIIHIVSDRLGASRAYEAGARRQNGESS